MGVLTLWAGSGSLTGSLDPKLGIVAIKIKCDAPDITTAVTGAIPDIGVAGLVEWQPRTFERRAGGENDGYDVFITVEGHLKPDEANEEDYSLEDVFIAVVEKARQEGKFASED